ncbi:MAG: nitronate monooxygenase, partial [Desulfobacterales bacterium]|nr:nitronate monooxygenase [Desulfobacterales bacterium]
MIQTELTRRLGIRYPLIGGAMMSISTPEYVAAVSNAGGLGILASTIYKTPDEFSATLDRALMLTDKPFAVNLSLFPAIRPVDNDLYLDIM